jgi:hypothetical protein
MKRLFGAVILSWPCIAFADTTSFSTADGRTFLYVGADEDGLLYPEDDPSDSYTMNFDCTVNHDKLGKGEWRFANGGWVIEFGGEVKLGFPRQSPPLDIPDCAF